MYSIVLTEFSLQDSLEKVWFFKEIFLLFEISIEVIIKMFFLTLSYAEVKLTARELTWRKYIIIELMPTVRRVESIYK